MKGALIIDVFGLLSFALVCAGVCVVFGRGWMLIVAGAPPSGLYLWHVWRILRRRRPRNE